MATIFVKNTDKSEKLFNHVFEQASGKSLSELLKDQYGLADQHLPLENNRFTIAAFTLEASHIKVSIDESIVDTIWENLNDNIYTTSQRDSFDFVIGEMSHRARDRKGADDVIVSDWVVIAYHTMCGDKKAVRDCTTMVFKDYMPDDTAAIRTAEFTDI